MSTTTDLTELTINVLSKAQYDSATKNENELYLTPGMEDISSMFTFGGAWTGLVKKAYRVGKLVFFHLEASVSSYQANYNYTMCTIASGYRPLWNTVFYGYTTDGSYNPKSIISARSAIDGNIIVNAQNTTGSYFFVTGFYETT